MHRFKWLWPQSGWYNKRIERMAKLLNTPDRLCRHAQRPLLVAKQQSLCHLVGQRWCLRWFGLGWQAQDAGKNRWSLVSAPPLALRSIIQISLARVAKLFQRHAFLWRWRIHTVSRREYGTMAPLTRCFPVKWLANHFYRTLQIDCFDMSANHRCCKAAIAFSSGRAEMNVSSSFVRSSTTRPRRRRTPTISCIGISTCSLKLLYKYRSQTLESVFNDMRWCCDDEGFPPARRRE